MYICIRYASSPYYRPSPILNANKATNSKGQQPQQPTRTAETETTPTKQRPANSNNDSNTPAKAPAAARSKQLKLPDFTHQQECGQVGMNGSNSEAQQSRPKHCPLWLTQGQKGLSCGQQSEHRQQASSDSSNHTPPATHTRTHTRTHAHIRTPHCICFYAADAAAVTVLLRQRLLLLLL